MTKRTAKSREAPTGQKLGEKLLKSVREMKAGRAARTTQVAPIKSVGARLKTDLSRTKE